MNDFFSKKYIFKNQTVMVVSVCLEPLDFFRPFLSILMGVQLRCVFLREILPTRPLQPDQLSEKQLVERSKSLNCAIRAASHTLVFSPASAHVMSRFSKTSGPGKGEGRCLDLEVRLGQSRVCHLPESAQRLQS